jgi:hypothetical protein
MSTMPSGSKSGTDSGHTSADNDYVVIAFYKLLTNHDFILLFISILVHYIGRMAFLSTIRLENKNRRA